MEKIDLKKNRLDLEFHFESQKINAILALLTTGILGFISNFIWLKSIYFMYGFLITITIVFLSIYFYKKTSNKMKSILIQIENL